MVVENVPRVMYASFGSNLLRDRFLCYIQGGRVEGLKSSMPGCRDRRPPRTSKSHQIPHTLFFGLEKSWWGRGGVCFIDSEPSTEAKETCHMCAYDITLEQFNDVVAQENSLEPGSVEVISNETLDQIKRCE
eukprot:8607935-Pyramimonas_sp.AAC.1